MSLAGTCSIIRHFLLLPSSTVIWATAHSNKSLLDHESNGEPEVDEDAASASARRLLLLRTRYYMLLDAQFQESVDTFPPFSDLGALKGAQKRLAETRSDTAVNDVALWLVKAVDSWRLRCQSRLLALIPDSNAIDKPHLLYKATSVWRNESFRPLWYPALTLGEPYSIKDGLIPQSNDIINYDNESAATVEKLCDLALLDATTAIQRDFDVLSIRFRCKLCTSDGPPCVYNWRQAVSDLWHLRSNSRCFVLIVCLGRTSTR